MASGNKNVALFFQADKSTGQPRLCR